MHAMQRDALTCPAPHVLNTHTGQTLLKKTPVKQNTYAATRRIEHTMKKRAAGGRGEARRPI
jgi:hypothetical protein